MGATPLSIVAISGADWRVLWETEIGDRATMPEQPRLRFVPEHSTVLFAMGAAIRAFDGKTGQQKWVANLPDKTDVMLLDGDALWVRAIDESVQTIALTTGVLTPASSEGEDKPKPNPSAKPLRTDYGYDLIPDNRQLDLGYEQFADVRIDTAFCPPELLAVSLERQHFDPLPCTWKHGLAWVSRNKGTAVPFLIAYDPASKQERWRQQLTEPGSLETIDTGFNQPRAEFVEDDAVISFSPSSANGVATIRRISLSDGATKWQTTLTRKSTENVDGMVIGKDRLYVDHGGCVVVLELATGKELERLGGW
jgi:outer membrane protein assembly factor BamB